MKLPMVNLGDPLLRRRSRDVRADEIQSDAIRTLIADMRETMREFGGVGLAAAQVGVGLRLLVLEDGPELMQHLLPEQIADRERKTVPFQVLINPRIVGRSVEETEFFEACLSVPGLAGVVRRRRSLSVDALDEDGQPLRVDASGWHARILAHELDHLDGHTYVERAWPGSLTTTENFVRHWAGASSATARAWYHSPVESDE